MVSAHLVHAVRQHLFTDRDVQVFVVLDGASVSGLQMSLYRPQPDYGCLYRGDLAPDSAEVALYLVRLDPAAMFTDWVVTQGWGQHWGVFTVSDADLRELRRHLLRLLIVHHSDGKPLLFRYYDPWVLRVYLPTCNAEELSTIFGPVKSYLLGEESPQIVLRFQVASGAGALRQDRLWLVTSVAHPAAAVLHGARRRVANR